MRRILTVLAVAALMAAMMVVMAAPAMAASKGKGTDLLAIKPLDSVKNLNDRKALQSRELVALPAEQLGTAELVAYEPLVEAIPMAVVD
jgi:hypothetical protein